MKAKTFYRLLQIARSYRTQTQFIDSYNQQVETEERNRRLKEEFNQIVQTYWASYNRGIPASVVERSDSEEALLRWVWSTDQEIEDPDPRLQAVINRLIEESES